MDEDRVDRIYIILFLIILTILLLLLSGCAAPVSAAPPVQEAVPMMRAEATLPPDPEEPKFAHVRVIEIRPDAPVQKRLAVYNPDMWDYPYRDWQATEIPAGEAWEGWYATTATGMATVEWEYSTNLIYGGIEASADLETWYRVICLDHDYRRNDEGTRMERVSFILVADPVTGETDRQFYRLNFPWRDLK